MTIFSFEIAIFFVKPAAQRYRKKTLSSPEYLQMYLKNHMSDTNEFLTQYGETGWRQNAAIWIDFEI
jgi:hypothetical protein